MREHVCRKYAPSADLLLRSAAAAKRSTWGCPIQADQSGDGRIIKEDDHTLVRDLILAFSRSNGVGQVDLQPAGGIAYIRW